MIREFIKDTIAAAGLVAVVVAGFLFALAMDAPDPTVLYAPDPIGETHARQ